MPALVLLAPVGLALGALIRFKLGGPVLFRQRRPGRDGQIFELIKFRTMTDARDPRGKPLPDEQRELVRRWIEGIRASAAYVPDGAGWARTGPVRVVEE